jgi:hypothetical protein
MDDGDGWAISTSVEKKDAEAKCPLRPDLKPASSEEAAILPKTESEIF